MPTYNEGLGVIDFIEEICNEFESVNFCIIVVDDYSNAKSQQELINLVSVNRKVILVRNNKNLGHGPSTVVALNYALNIGCKYIIATDGDGQFLAADLFRIWKSLVEGSKLVEGVRCKRKDPLFRVITTFLVRILIYSKTKRIPRDGNTPLRGYDAGVLSELLEELPQGIVVPNIVISILVRKRGIEPLEIGVTSMPPRGHLESGITWNQKFRQLPSIKFIRFCFMAFRQLIRFRQV